MDLGGSGGTEVVAAFDGHVTVLNTENINRGCAPPHFGAEIFIRSHNDRVGAFYTHVKNLGPSVALGRSVARGDRIGELINCGAGTHLHFALKENVGARTMGVDDLFGFFERTGNTTAGTPVRFFQDGTTQPAPQAASC